jgi:hypothetical protein
MKAPVLFFILISFQIFSSAEKLKKVYLDKAGYVHVITEAGSEISLKKHGPGNGLILSPDRRAAAWLAPENPNSDGVSEDAPSILHLYKDGKVRTADCDQLIRQYWFVRRGERIAIDCGPRHFAGKEILYDSSTLKIIESFDQSEIPIDDRPSWADGGNK